MKKRLLIVLLFAAVAGAANAAEAQVIVIANPSVKSASVSKGELRDVFTGAAANFNDGSHVTPVLLKQGAAHEEFLSAYVGKSDTALRTSWRSLVFSGQGTMPKSVDSEAAVVEYVAHNSGAVGYVSAATAHEGVKVLAVK
jgi:ABC-type phosphate transport system substrate-binding protein